VTVSPIDVLDFQDNATAVASSAGHLLGEWWDSASLATANRCVHCHASTALMVDGTPTPSSTIDKPCRLAPDAPRYFAAKSGRNHYVRDRRRPEYEPCSMHASKGAAAKAAAARNGGGVVIDLAKARARVARAEAALAKARAELETAVAA